MPADNDLHKAANQGDEAEIDMRVVSCVTHGVTRAAESHSQHRIATPIRSNRRFSCSEIRPPPPPHV